MSPGHFNLNMPKMELFSPGLLLSTLTKSLPSPGENMGTSVSLPFLPPHTQGPGDQERLLRGIGTRLGTYQVRR